MLVIDMTSYGVSVIIFLCAHGAGIATAVPWVLQHIVCKEIQCGFIAKEEKISQNSLNVVCVSITLI
jgi:hypothetical protein